MTDINLNDICNYIKDNYKNLPKSKINEKELVIFAIGGFYGEYGHGSSDLQSYGVDFNGDLFWAFASGCSCNCGAGIKFQEKTIKLTKIKDIEDVLAESVLKMIRLFLINKEEFVKSLKSYEYSSW